MQCGIQDIKTTSFCVRLHNFGVFQHHFIYNFLKTEKKEHLSQGAAQKAKKIDKESPIGNESDKFHFNFLINKMI